MDAELVARFEDTVLQHPEAFFTPSEELAQSIKGFTKHAFDHCIRFVSKKSATPLDQLYVDGFDADQIWEQLQLQNGPLVEELATRIRQFQKHPTQIRLFPDEREDNDSDPSEEEGGTEESAEEHSASDADLEEEALHSDDAKSDDDQEKDGQSTKQPSAIDKSKKAKKSKKARDVAEDGFFDWDEMDKMAEEEEMSGDEDDDQEELDDEDVDGDEDFLDDEDDDDEEDDLADEEAANMTYSDFFEPKKSRRTDKSEADEEGEEDGEDEQEEDDDALAESDDEMGEDLPSIKRPDPEEDVDEDDLAERGVMSSHQRHRHRLQKEIAQLEEEALAEKPWLLKGEVRSGARPENSLLEAVLDYDRPTKVAPVITVEVSVALEDMIKKRILEDDFDDVIRKFAANEEDEKKKLVDVSMEKSKEGLGEVYEKEYMKTAMGFEADDESKQDQDEIEVMFKSLCWKLDALSNYQFTPKPMVKELQVKPSVPAIAMEEVVPISVSDANLKAPEEVFEKKRKRGEAVLQSKEEMTQEERKAQRSAKKRVRRKEKRQQEADERLVAKINPGLGNKYEKKKMLESIANAKNVTKGKEIEGSTKQFSNSKEFFSRLQEEVQGEIRKKAAKSS